VSVKNLNRHHRLSRPGLVSLPGSGLLWEVTMKILECGIVFLPMNCQHSQGKPVISYLSLQQHIAKDHNFPSTCIV